MSGGSVFEEIISPLWLYEESYRLLDRLVPALDATPDMQLLHSPRAPWPLRLLILERGHHTSLIELELPFAWLDEWLPHLVLRVRICHDAQVADVVAWQGILRPYGRDASDRRRVNQLLLALLRHALRYEYQ
jgi:uncharacterized protein YqiB (DUF1249 family)